MSDLTAQQEATLAQWATEADRARAADMCGSREEQWSAEALERKVLDRWHDARKEGL